MASTTTSLTIPAHLYAHTEVQINDNTIRTYTRVPKETCKILAVFHSPKGEDRVMKTIEGGLDEFDDTFGVGPYSTYGQPLLNARAAINTGNVTLQCLRITAPDATYANNVVWVQYKATAGTPGTAGIAVGDMIPAVYWGEGEIENVVHHADEVKTPAVYYEEGETTTDPDTGEETEHHANEIKTQAVYWTEGEVEEVTHHSNQVKVEAHQAREDEVTEAVAAVPGKLEVKFVTAPFVGVTNINDFNETFDALTADYTNFEGNGNLTVSIPTLEAGWRQMPFIGFISKGRGSYGDAYSFRISNHPRADKTSVYKNYFVRVFEGTRTVDASTRVTLYEDAIINNWSLHIEEVINGLNNGVTGSKNVRCKVNNNVLSTLYELYTSEGLYPNTYIPLAAFDPILGVDRTLALSKSSEYTAFADVVKANSGMPGFKILNEPGTVQFNTMTGIKLTNGSDGAFALSADPEAMKARSKAIRVAYYNAFTANEEAGYDRDIMSKTKFPLDAVFDADFPIGVLPTAGDDVDQDAFLNDPANKSLKDALAGLVEERHEDCFCFMDLGTDRQSMLDSDPGALTAFDTKEAAYEYSNELDYSVNWWNYSIDAYYGKIRDPYNKKIITVTSTYNLSVNYPRHWKYYGGKHIPYAGSKYGVIDQYIPRTIFPVFDVDLDPVHLDKLTDQHVNYAQINSKMEIIRGSQLTRYPVIGDALTVSNLSETNNALIILDIKKDAIRLVENYAYNFNEASDIALFNRDAEQLVTKYREAQVRSITATFSRTEEEAELGILHLTITVIHKALVKINLIDIDVNRAVTPNS